MAVDLNNLKKKVDAGADFLITQLFFENRHYWEFVERARAAWESRFPVIPGIMPITNAAQVERFTLACGATLAITKLADQLNRRRHDPAAVLQLGVAHATSQCIDLLTGRRAPEIHFYTLNRSTASRGYCERSARHRFGGETTSRKTDYDRGVTRRQVITGLGAAAFAAELSAQETARGRGKARASGFRRRKRTLPHAVRLLAET